MGDFCLHLESPRRLTIRLIGDLSSIISALARGGTKSIFALGWTRAGRPGFRKVLSPVGLIRTGALSIHNEAPSTKSWILVVAGGKSLLARIVCFRIDKSCCALRADRRITLGFKSRLHEENAPSSQILPRLTLMPTAGWIKNGMEGARDRIFGSDISSFLRLATPRRRT